MRVFVYEFITGGGTLAKPSWGTPGGSLLSEGRAMIRAITDDLIRLSDVSVVAMWDARLQATIDSRVERVNVSDAASEKVAFNRLAKICDATLVIAPEIENELFVRCEQVKRLGGNSLGANPEFVKLASDKQATIDALKEAGVRVPHSEVIGPNTVWIGRRENLIAKPRLGAGSQDLHLVQPGDDSENRIAKDGSFLLQSFCVGRPASIAFLCGRKQRVELFPFFQNLGEDFSYRGGTRIMSESMCERALQLGRRAIEVFPGARGYVGVDIILGPKTDGSDDTVIEINPRLTTSYIGNRAVATQNLAGSMLRSFHDEPIDTIAGENEVHFKSDGRIA